MTARHNPDYVRQGEQPVATLLTARAAFKVMLGELRKAAKRAQVIADMANRRAR
jgi:hypothetical protein